MKRNKSRSNSKLDPLFDYTKQLPPAIDLDDDDDDLIILSPSKLNGSRLGIPPLKVNSGVGKEGIAAQNDQVSTVVDDNDWLEPPPSKSTCPRVLPVDPTLLRLRQQKAELQRIWQESENSVRIVEEAQAERLHAQATMTAAQQYIVSCGDGGSPLSTIRRESSVKRRKILLKLQGQDDEIHSIRIYADDKFEKLFNIFTNLVDNRSAKDYVFRFDGQQLSSEGRPKDLDLEDEDIIEFSPKARR